MNLESPTLNYVGSVDTTTAQGSTKYIILFNSSVSTLGNVLMFEYKIQEQGAAANPTNVTLGSIAVENAIQSGMSNQYILSVPALDNDYDPSVPLNIQFRVYSGVLGSNEVAVTDWSNDLDVHVPPNQQVISSAFYDPVSVNYDDLYVFLDIDPEVDITGPSAVKFIVCYYYTDPSGATVWDVSQPISAEVVTVPGSGDKWMIHIGESGQINIASGNIYVSVHAVFEFESGGESYYSVSQVSNTYPATPASDDYKPTITNINYNVYTPPHNDQTMDITWSPPSVSILPTFTVDFYILEYSIDGGVTWDVIDDDIPPAPGNAPVTYGPFVVSIYGCGTTVSYRVRAVSTNGTLGGWSDTESKDIFYYSGPVENLFVSNTSYVDYTNQVTLTVNFNPPSDTGCGVGYRFVVSITNDYGETLEYITYNPTTSLYEQTYTGPFSQSGTVNVYLETYDTNSPQVLAGESASASYLAINFILNPIVYNVYNNGAQTFDLTWSQPTLAPWSIINYQTQVQVTPPSGSPGAWTTFDTGNNTLVTYNATSAGTDNVKNNLAFRVVANMDNSETSTTYTAYSNVEDYNIFKYSGTPAGSVNWSVAVNGGTSSMDMNLQFQNPIDTGINNGLNYFKVAVYNSGLSPSELASVDVLANTNVGQPTGVTYDDITEIYTVDFNNIPYASNGTVRLTTYVNNSNTNTTPTSTAVLTNGSYTPLIYTTGTIPIFQNVQYTDPATKAEVTGRIVSYQLLKPIGQVLYPTGSLPPVDNVQYLTSGGTSGFTISSQEFSNGVYVYSFTITTATLFPSGNPTGFAITAANDSGIGVGRV
jgi:hypothetical protein